MVQSSYGATSRGLARLVVIQFLEAMLCELAVVDVIDIGKQC